MRFWKKSWIIITAFSLGCIYFESSNFKPIQAEKWKLLVWKFESVVVLLTIVYCSSCWGKYRFEIEILVLFEITCSLCIWLFLYVVFACTNRKNKHAILLGRPPRVHSSCCCPNEALATRAGNNGRSLTFTPVPDSTQCKLAVGWVIYCPRIHPYSSLYFYVFGC
jgi:hypothetical protein